MRWVLLAGLVLAAQGQTLPEKLKARIGDFAATVSLYAKNLDSGATVQIRGSEPVRTASTIKLPILCAVSDAVAHDKAKWTELLTVTATETLTNDTGTSNSDRITNDGRVTLSGTCDDKNSTIKISNGGTVVGTTSVDSRRFPRLRWERGVRLRRTAMTRGCARYRLGA